MWGNGWKWRTIWWIRLENQFIDGPFPVSREEHCRSSESKSLDLIRRTSWPSFTVTLPLDNLLQNTNTNVHSASQTQIKTFRSFNHTVAPHYTFSWFSYVYSRSCYRMLSLVGKENPQKLFHFTFLLVINNETASRIKNKQTPDPQEADALWTAERRASPRPRVHRKNKAGFLYNSSRNTVDIGWDCVCISLQPRDGFSSRPAQCTTALYILAQSCKRDSNSSKSEVESSSRLNTWDTKGSRGVASGAFCKITLPLFL